LQHASSQITMDYYNTSAFKLYWHVFKTLNYHLLSFSNYTYSVGSKNLNKIYIRLHANTKDKKIYSLF
jgi:hypothetical protein